MRSIPRLAIAVALISTVLGGAVVASAVEPAPPLSGEQPDHIEALREYAPRSRLCRPIGPNRLEALAPQAVAGIRCRPPRDYREPDLPLQIRYYRFATAEAMDDWWASVLTTEPDGPWRQVGAHEFPIERNSGTLDVCRSLRYGEAWGETGFLDRDGRAGRLACWKGGVESDRCDGCVRIHPTLHWTVADELIGAMAAGPDAGRWHWFAHPGWQQADLVAPPGAARNEPFAPSDSLHPLPDWVADVAIPGGTAPRSRPSLGVGRAIPLIVGHCDTAAQTYDIDGSWWMPAAGAGPDGRPISDDRFGVFEEGSRASFVLIDDDTAQLRLPDGHVFEYDRAEGGVKRYGCY